MFNPAPKPPPREKKPRQPLRSKTRLKTTTRLKSSHDPIPDAAKDEVDARDGLICQECGQPVRREDGPYHHVQFRSHRYEPMVRFWHRTLDGWDWMMVQVWFEFHSKENIVTLCPWGCHDKAQNTKEGRYKWERWRDERYGGQINVNRGEC